MKIFIPKTVLVQKLGEELVLLNLDSEQYFGLDDVGTSIWHFLQETGSIEAACERLLKVYRVEPEKLREDLHNLVEHLAKYGLVQIIEA